ncbi:hypothetical protein MMC17_003950 [Xylographa soralifera]|nr:hypothetical protein [Xylographa soralifera]
MAVTMSKARVEKETPRRLKAHKKSRGGCGNCKLRKVKCDETRPMCKRCNVYGTFCNYDSKYSSLQPLSHRVCKIQTLQIPLCSEHQTILGVINSSTSPTSSDSTQVFHGGYQFCAKDLELLYKFRTRTLLTLGSAEYSSIYQNAFAKLAFSHPFLLHIVLTLTLSHDQHLSNESSVELSAAIAFHWARGAALLNQKLSDGIKPTERDALWACAGLLGALGFSSIRAKTPEEAWPLMQSSPSDLDWLKMSEGKKALWEISDPTRADSLFYPMAPWFKQLEPFASSSGPEMQNLLPELIHLCEIDGTMLQDNSAYLPSLSFFARTGNIECNTHNLAKFLRFFGRMHPNFRHLIERKDPRALLLLAYWYAKVCQCQQWWLWRRANLECQAICIYLRRYHGDDINILNATRYPEMACTSQALLDTQLCPA